jgi:hypothetical protein
MSKVDEILNKYANWISRETGGFPTPRQSECLSKSKATKALKELLLSEAVELNNGELDKAHWQGLAIPIEAINRLFDVE